MDSAIANQDYALLVGGEHIDFKQKKGDQLEVWKVREDGFNFVYSNDLEIGYWCHPKLIDIN